MNPALLAAVTTANAHAMAVRMKLVKRLEQLPPSEATRERVLQGQDQLAPVLDRLLQEGMVRKRTDGTLLYDLERVQEANRKAGKVALVVFAALAAIAGGTALALVAFGG